MKIERSSHVGAWACSLCGEPTAGDVIAFTGVPYILGVTDHPQSVDRTVDFNVGECPHCGLVQHDQEISGEMYSEIHSHAVGKVWADHFAAFTAFIRDSDAVSRRILEVGPSSSPMTRGLRGDSPGVDRSATYVDFMAAPPFTLQAGETYHSGYFPHAQLRGQQFDTVLASHVIEHAPHLGAFFENLVECLTPDGSIFLSVPDFEEWIGKTYWNAFSLEHVTYPVLKQMAWLAAKFGLGCRTADFAGHSAFFEFSRRLPLSTFNATSSLWLRSALPWQAKVRAQMDAFESTLQGLDVPVYLTGASHLSQYLIASSDSVRTRCVGIFDNASSKWGKRLYGTEVTVQSFDELSSSGTVAVLVPASPYQREIVEQIRRLNAHAVVVAK